MPWSDANSPVDPKMARNGTVRAAHRQGGEQLQKKKRFLTSPPQHNPAQPTPAPSPPPAAPWPARPHAPPWPVDADEHVLQVHDVFGVRVGLGEHLRSQQEEVHCHRICHQFGNFVDGKVSDPLID